MTVLDVEQAVRVFGSGRLRVLVLTLLVIRGPLRRATRIRPGTALRYQ